MSDEKKEKGGRLHKQQKTAANSDQQRRIFKKKRASTELTRTQVREIKAGRKALRKEMRARGIRSRKEFETTASSLGLYFDRNRLGAFFWFLSGRGLWALLGAALALLGALALISVISQMRGYFTINLTDGLFKEGIALSETPDFETQSSALTALPATDVPEYSISFFEDDIDTGYYGEHNADYFAYTFFLRYEAEDDSEMSYRWEVDINSEEQSLSEAVWVMIFEDGEMAFYAKVNENGETECLPAKSVNNVGYLDAPLIQYSAAPDDQYEVIATSGSVSYYRVIPYDFVSDTVVATGGMDGVLPGDVHRYTVVVWLEGDDPDCTDDLIGGHLGLNMQFSLVTEDGDEDSSGNTSGGWWTWFQNIFDNLKWWNG
ncbi:MAG: hypothetical protein LUC32_00225 [Clostridiales bacterium]|nr:hypothetical protein [Clostridiales bacterium]